MGSTKRNFFFLAIILFANPKRFSHGWNSRKNILKWRHFWKQCILLNSGENKYLFSQIKEVLVCLNCTILSCIKVQQLLEGVVSNKVFPLIQAFQRKNLLCMHTEHINLVFLYDMGCKQHEIPRCPTWLSDFNIPNSFRWLLAQLRCIYHQNWLHRPKAKETNIMLVCW